MLKSALNLYKTSDQSWNQINEYNYISKTGRWLHQRWMFWTCDKYRKLYYRASFIHHLDLVIKLQTQEAESTRRARRRRLHLHHLYREFNVMKAKEVAVLVLLIMCLVVHGNADKFTLGYITGSSRRPWDKEYSRPGLSISGKQQEI